MSARVIIGVDGGGTRTRAVAVSEAGTELARVTGEAGLVDPADPGTAAASVARLVIAVAAAAGAELPVYALGCGLAGAGRQAERDAVRAVLLTEGLADRVVVAGDAAAALQDAFGSGPGVLLVAGTGSIAWGRSVDGEARVGGWGALLGDEGSGYCLGVEALRAAARASDGRAPPTCLTDALLAHTGVAEPPALIAWAAAAGKAAVAALSSVVLACAAEGDPAAAAIRDEAVRQLVELAVCAARRVRLDTPRVALAGGLLAPGAPLRDEVVAGIRAALPRATISDRTIDAAMGAANLALA
ncbi:MAG: BadF/BadG/BcrA/BcrD ATPase family protein [Gemmatimonadota bacterium]